MLWWLSESLQPRIYLEVGFREGASLCCVLGQEREIIRFAVDMLADQRTRITEDIIDQVRQRFTVRPCIRELYLFDSLDQTPYRRDITHIEGLIRNGFMYSHAYGSLCFGVGDSKQQLPRCFETFPDLVVDLALVDGGHDRETVKSDLDNLAGHFKVLVVHDVNHLEPGYEHIPRLVKNYSEKHGYPMLRVGQRRFGTAVLLGVCF